MTSALTHRRITQITKVIAMTMPKRDVEKRRGELKEKIAQLESRCQGGSGTKDDYEELAKLKRKLH